MKWLVDTWGDFTESLNTRGGTIALLFVATLLLGLCVIHFVHDNDSGQAVSIITGTFANFTGALLLALTQKDKERNGNGTSVDVKKDEWKPKGVK